MVESSEDAIIGKDLDGIIISWNRGAEKMYGYLADEIKGQSVKKLLPGEDASEIENILKRLGGGEQFALMIQREKERMARL
ncbi:MAG TPA: PAS domain S-box protein [Candidatus Paceibacterota bacterium]|nr:PAS domain S-box protein [Candidatus Paceibacterota bacterium]